MMYVPAGTHEELIQNGQAYIAAMESIAAEGTINWKRGQACYRQMCAAMTAHSLAFINTTKAPLSELKTHIQLMSHDPVFGQVGKMFQQVHGGASFDPTVDLLKTFIHAKSVEKTESPAWFHLSKGLLWALQHTDLKNTLASHINLPFEAFFFSIPPGVFYIEDGRTGLHQARYVGVAEDVRPGFERGLSTIVCCEPNENSVDLFDDRVSAWWIPLPNDDIPLETLILYHRYRTETMYDLWNQIIETTADGQLVRYKPNSEYLLLKETLRRMAAGEPLKGDRGLPFKTPEKDASEELRSTLPGGKPRNSNAPDIDRCYLFGKEYTGYDKWNLIAGLVVNALLYVNSVSIHKKHVHTTEIEALKKKWKNLNNKKGNESGKASIATKIHELNAINEWFIGTDITIDPDDLLPQTEHPPGGTTGRTLKTPSITRGHWRHQAHGPHHSLRKLIWIAPFVRGRQLGNPNGHNYHVEFNEKMG